MTESAGRPLRVGVDLAPPPPMCFGVPGAPEFKGFEVDLLTAIGERLQRPLAFDASLWADLLGRLDEGTLDLICTAVTVTPERMRQFELSDPYLDTGLVLIGRRDQASGLSSDRSPGLCGVLSEALTAGLSPGVDRVGVRVGTPAEAYARQVAPRHLASFHFNDEIYRALANDELDAVVDDWPIGAWFAAQSPALAIGGRIAGTEASYALALRRGDREGATMVNRVLGELQADGTYRALYERWMAPVVGDSCDVTRRGGAARGDRVWRAGRM